MSLAKGALLGLVLFAGACGGSSSETPFPLEPDFRREKSAAAGREVVFSGREQGDGGGADSDEGDDLETEPAAPTWGAKPSKRRPRDPEPSEPEPAEPEIELEPQ